MAIPGSPNTLDYGLNGEPLANLVGQSSSATLDYQLNGEPYGGVAKTIGTASLSVADRAIFLDTAAPPDFGQDISPVSDVSNTGLWTNELGTLSPLYPSVGEAVAYDPTFIQSPAGPANAPVVIHLGAAATPITGTQTLQVRLGKDLPGGHRIDHDVDLLQGATVIQSWTFTDVAAGETTYPLVVTNPIDWTIATDLRITGNQP